MQAYSQSPSLKINEVEFNPPGKISGNQWIEIYNPSNFLLDISNFLIKSVELGRSIQVSSGFVVEPNGYVVIPFQTRALDEKRDSIVLLTPDSVEIDKTPFLSDEVDDDKEKIQSREDSILMRPAEPEYISSVVAFLLSEDSKYISGQVIRIDGGQFTSPI